jgi:hypothetical protein
MSHTFHVSEEEYADLAAYAEGINETPDWVFQAWVQGMIDRMEARKSAQRKLQLNTSHTFHVSDEQYAKLVNYADKHKVTPEKLFQTWIDTNICADIETSGEIESI